MSDRAARWIVSGRVQGVGFRWYTMKAASRLGIAGWVRNQADGTVEVAAAGSPEAIAELEKAIAKGPSFSRVMRVERHDISLENLDCNAFEIR